MRAGTPADQSLIARRVSEVELITCASPIYIERFGMPERPEDLEADHHSVNYFRAQNNRTVPLEFRRHNEVIEITPRYIAAVNDSRTYLTATLAGLGIAQVPIFMAREPIARCELVEVLPDWRRDPLPLYVVYPPNRHLSNKVRVFVDWLVKLLAETRLNDR